jgi:hypothetical protein
LGQIRTSIGPEVARVLIRIQATQANFSKNGSIKIDSCSLQRHGMVVALLIDWIKSFFDDKRNKGGLP